MKKIMAFLSFFAAIFILDAEAKMCQAKVRFINIIPGKNLSLKINGKDFPTLIARGEVTDYVDIKKVILNLQIEGKDAAQSNIPLIPNNIYTIAISGSTTNPELNIIEDDIKQKPLRERARVKIYLLTDEFNNATVSLEDDSTKKTLPKLPPFSPSIYLDIKAGKQNLTIGTAKFSVEAVEGSVNSIFVTGDKDIENVVTKTSETPGCIRVEK